MSPTYLRSFIFGVEDSLVSTVGLLSGVAIANASRETILLTGTVLIFVEAFSMAAGSFLSESSVEEYEKRRVVSGYRPVLTGVIMFFSYFVAGFIPLAPYALMETSSAFAISIAASLAALFLLGALGGRFSQTSIWRSAIRMAVVGGMAILVGVVVGQFFVVPRG